MKQMFGHKKQPSKAVNPGPLQPDAKQAALVAGGDSGAAPRTSSTLEVPGTAAGAAAAAATGAGQILVYQDGSLYQGGVQDGVPHGTGTWSSLDGETYEGEW